LKSVLQIRSTLMRMLIWILFVTLTSIRIGIAPVALKWIRIRILALKIKAQNFEKVLKYYFILAFYLQIMRIRIRIITFTLMRIRILPFCLTWIQGDPDPQH